MSTITGAEPRLFSSATEARAARPFHFLVTTSPAATGLGAPVDDGDPASTRSALMLLAPLLERFGTWRTLDHPESRLAFAARQAEERGSRAVQLVLAPVHEAYLTPAVPTILFPMVDHPDIPSRNFGLDARRNWARVARRADLILTPSRFAAEAFRRAGVDRPVVPLGLPANPAWFDIPPWEGSRDVRIAVAHEATAPVEPTGETPAVLATTPPPPRTGPRAKAADLFEQIEPWIDPRGERRVRHRLRSLASRVRVRSLPPLRSWPRAAQRALIRRLLSHHWQLRLIAAKQRVRNLAGRPLPPAPPSEAPSAPAESTTPTLELGPGLVYHARLRPSDPRANVQDLISAFVIAFRDRADVTLVVEIAAPEASRHWEGLHLIDHARATGIPHRCRIVAITEPLDPEASRRLMSAVAYAVNVSRGEGTCPDLIRALAAGRPAIAPAHSALADVIDAEVAFVPRTSTEPARWPDDPELRLETTQQRLNWSDLHDAFLASARVAEHDRPRYHAMSAAARRRIEEVAGLDALADRLAEALQQLPDRPAGAFSWDA